MLRNLGISPEGAIEFAEEYLKGPGDFWRKLDLATQQKLQWFQFSSGLVYDGEVFRTAEVASVFKTKDAFLASSSTSVDLRRFELLTPSLQMRCSTN